MNIDRIKTLFQFILAFAGQADDYYHRRLRPIHLLKYAYLADLAFAERNNGQTFTGITWKFHHFGPWSLEAFKQIDPALDAIRANSRVVENYYDDTERKEWWWSGDDNELDFLRKSLPGFVVYPVQQHIRQFGGNATHDLLHYVYSTEPMRKAAPEDVLIFPSVSVSPPMAISENETISARQRKLRRVEISEAKALFQERLAQKISAANQRSGFVSPKYDEEFFEGLAYFEATAANDLEPGDYILEIDQSLWKSGSRENHDLS